MTDEFDPTTHAINPVAVNQATIAEARERQARRRKAAEPAAPKPEVLLSARAAAIKAAAKRAAPRDQVALTELSKYTPGGETIYVKVRRLAIQELAASELLPGNATRLVDRLIRRGQEATDAERKRRGQQEAALPLKSVNEEIDDAIEHEFAGMTTEAVDALYGLINAVCVVAVVDPEMHLYFSEADANRDPYGTWIMDVPQDDRFAIFNWAMTVEDEAAATVEPFRQPAALDGGPVPADEARRDATFDADQV